MIQRIQTVFLVLGALCTIPLLFFDFGFLTKNLETFSLLFNGFYVFGDEYELIVRVIPFSVLIFITMASTTVAIFLYKKRILQIRLSVINIGLLLGIIGMAIFLCINAAKEWDMNYSFTAALFYPIFSISLILLAIRYIWADENLLKSSDRIR